jgi:hypothetical protein
MVREGVVMELRGAGLSRLTLAVGLVLAVALAGCSSEPSQEEAEAAVCADLADVRTAAEGVRALDAGSTLDQAQAAEDALAAAVDDLKASVAEVPDADAAAIDAAAQQISAAIADVSGGDTLGGAAAAVADSTNALAAAFGEMNNGLDCGLPALEPLSSLTPTGLPTPTS